VATAIRALLFSAILTIGVPGVAHAEWQLAPFLGRTFKVDTNIVDLDLTQGNAHWNFGGTVTLIGAGPVGVEGLIVYTPGFFQQEEPPGQSVTQSLIVSSRSLAMMGNVVLTTPRRWNEYGLRPFLSGGIGLLQVRADDFLDVFPLRANLWGYNIGGGAVGFLTEVVGVRFDVRYFKNLKAIDDPDIPTIDFREGHVRYWTAGVGLVLRY
jgi:hypothetical protein